MKLRKKLPFKNKPKEQGLIEITDKPLPDWNQVPFVNYWNAVNVYLLLKYGLITRDAIVGIDDIEQAHLDGLCPSEFIDMLGDKNNLETNERFMPMFAVLCINFFLTTQVLDNHIE